jgi:flagellar basal-body rod protein FlgB
MHCRRHVTTVTAFSLRDPDSARPERENRSWHGHCSSSGPGQPFDGAFVAINIDSYLGVHAAALKLREQRTELLARNLANADTPGYKARDLDFGAALAAATEPAKAGVMTATQTGHIGTSVDSTVNAGSTEAFLKFRTPLAPSLDGNTVDAQLEQAAFADNAVRYQATLSLLSAKFRSLMTAITGQ